MPIRTSILLKSTIFLLIFGFLAARAISIFRSAKPLDGTAFLLLFMGIGALYIVSHLIRAARLAVISMVLLGASFRRIVLLHLFVCPWSIIMPFKLDEFLRLNELRHTGAPWTRSFGVLLLDRCLDLPVLLAIVCALRFGGRHESLLPVLLLGAATAAIVTWLWAIPSLLATTQRYVFVNHRSDASLAFLRLVDGLRRLAVHGRRVVTETAPFLAVTTVGIWFLEFLTAVLTLQGLGVESSIAHAAELMINRATLSSGIMLWNRPAGREATYLTLTFFYALFALWLMTPIVYARLSSATRGRAWLSTGQSDPRATRSISA